MRSRVEATVAEGQVLCLICTVPAARTAVYNALSDPRELPKWWGPRGFSVPSVQFDPRVGGSYWIAMQPPGKDLFYLLGEFREVDPPACLAYTFRWDPPDSDDRQTVARLSLQDRGDRTDVLLTQGTFATEDRLRLHAQGWNDCFERLEEVLRQAPG